MKNQSQGNKINTDDIYYRRETCPSILNGQRILQADNAKYLGLYLDHRLNWKRYIYQAQTTRITTGENVLAIR